LLQAKVIPFRIKIYPRALFGYFIYRSTRIAIWLAILKKRTKYQIAKKGNQALAVYPNLVRTHFEALWKTNQRVALF
jgi:hypothetical protein